MLATSSSIDVWLILVLSVFLFVILSQKGIWKSMRKKKIREN